MIKYFLKIKMPLHSHCICHGACHGCRRTKHIRQIFAPQSSLRFASILRLQSGTHVSYSSVPWQFFLNSIFFLNLKVKTKCKLQWSRGSCAKKILHKRSAEAFFRTWFPTGMEAYIYFFQLKYNLSIFKIIYIIGKQKFFC